ncbi:hypothetical protein DMH01_03280 [Amycolatopsis sp. WAC 04182]|uniref:hypothetical protein n=1 Tax=Amycolatopsis sp. WAC 04182 TaxID=2203198 RepID=UPI000F7A94BC|nr:hypothetical protein [Amycolatopsis sp. WAC 04182]RSN65413.1 hypothetical protein DMH01_03280 [Amycolatopsis sp. WAC 04182]
MAERSVNVKLRMDVAAYMAGARNAAGATKDLDKAARDLRRALDEEENAAGRARVANARLAEVQANAKAKASELAAAQEDAARASRALAVAQDNSADAANRFSQAQKSAATEAGRSSKKVDDAMGRLAKRTNAQFDALKFTGLSLGLPAAVAVGAVATTGSLALIAAGFAALGVAGVAHTDEVQGAFAKLRTSVVDDVRSMSAPLKGDVVGALDDVGAAWDRLAPSVSTAIQASAPAIRTLTGAVTDFAENAMPGMITAVKRSEPALEGLRTFSGQAGAGLSEFFVNVSEGAEGAGEGMETLGGTVRLLESRMGTLFANLANGSQGPLLSLHTIVDQVTGGLNDLTAQGSGAMGALQGFTNAGSGAATVLSGVLGAVSALPPQVAQFAGSMGAASMIAGQFGINAGKGFEGLGDKVRAATTSSDKFKAAISGMASGAVHPAFLAVAGLGLVLDTLGQKQQEAAEKTAKHAENVRGLTDALRKDKGVIGEQTQAWNAEALASKNAANNLAQFGQTMGTAKLAIEGNAGAYKALQDSANGRIAQLGKEMGLSDHAVGALQGITSNLLANGGAYEDVKGAVQQYTTVTDASGVATNRMSASQKAAFDSLFNGVGAVGEQMRAQRDAAAAYLASEHALTGLSAAQIRARDATTQHTQAIYDQVNASLGHRGAVLNVQRAMEDYKKVTENSKSTTLERAEAELKLEQAMQQQIAAAGKAAAASAQGATDKQKESIATAAMNAETVKLAGTFAGPLPASLQQTIAKMSVTEAKAAGLRVEIDNTGAAVYRLPDGRIIKLTGNNAQAMAAINEVQRHMNSIRDKQVTITVQQRYAATGGIGNAISQTGRAVAYAKGGMALPWGTVANDSGNLLQPKRMSGGLAMVIPPNTPRLIGDNMTHRELFAPLDGSQRSRELIIEAARHEKILPMANGGILSAAREALSHLQGGGQFFEDFSWYGNSANVSSYNDELAGLFYGANKGFDFDASDRTRDGIVSWLQGYVNQQAAAEAAQNMVVQSPVQEAITAGTLVQGSARGGNGAVVNLNIAFPRYVGTRDELVREIRSKVSELGGDVQNALGRRR